MGDRPPDRRRRHGPGLSGSSRRRCLRARGGDQAGGRRSPGCAGPRLVRIRMPAAGADGAPGDRADPRRGYRCARPSVSGDGVSARRADHLVVRCAPAVAAGARAADAAGGRGGAARAPERRDPSRSQTEQRAGQRDRWAADAGRDRFRHRHRCVQPRHDLRARSRHARLYEPGTGARRAGGGRTQRHLCAGRDVLRTELRAGPGGRLRRRAAAAIAARGCGAGGCARADLRGPCDHPRQAAGSAARWPGCDRAARAGAGTGRALRVGVGLAGRSAPLAGWLSATCVAGRQLVAATQVHPAPSQRRAGCCTCFDRAGCRPGCNTVVAATRCARCAARAGHRRLHGFGAVQRGPGHCAGSGQDADAACAAAGLAACRA